MQLEWDVRGRAAGTEHVLRPIRQRSAPAVGVQKGGRGQPESFALVGELSGSECREAIGTADLGDERRA